MAKRERTKAAEAAEDITFNPSEFEQTGTAVAESAPEDEKRFSGVILNPTSTRREPIGGHAAALTAKRKKVEHSCRQFPAGELVVHYMDKADNRAGIGIMVEFPDNRKPTDEEKEVIRRIVKGEGEKYPTDFKWNNDFGMWHKSFERPGEELRDVPVNRIRAIRYDAEKRAERLADALRHHAQDPAGYAEMITQQREQAAQRDRIPD